MMPEEVIDMNDTELAEEEERRHERMTTTPVSSLVLGLAGPSIVSMMVTTVYNTADTWFVSRLGTSASGAVSVVFALMAIYQAIGFMFGHGAGSNISVNLGAGHPEAARRYASTSFFWCLAVSAAFSAAGLFLLDPLMRLLGSTETILPYARQYAFWVILAGPLLSASCVLNNILRYEGHSSYAMVGLMTGGILNMAGDPLFMFILGLGVSGAGISTALSQTISFTILLLMFRRKDIVSEFRPRYVAPEIRTLADIVRVGLPSLFRQGLGSVATMMLNRQGAVYGDAAIAAMGIVSKVNNFGASIAIGIGQGFQPVSAYNYGAGCYGRVRRSFRFTMAAGTAVMVIFASVCLAFPAQIITWFREDPDVVAVGTAALRYQAISSVFLGYSMTASMLFQSTRTSGRAALIAAMRSGLFFIPLVMILPQFLGIVGIEIAQPCADVLSFAVCLPITEIFLKGLGDGSPEEMPQN